MWIHEQFFCGLHILVNFADVCAEALLKYERSIEGDNSITQDDDKEEEPQKIKQMKVELFDLYAHQVRHLPEVWMRKVV